MCVSEIIPDNHAPNINYSANIKVRIFHAAVTLVLGNLAENVTTHIMYHTDIYDNIY